MTATIINGRALADEIIQSVAERVARRVENGLEPPGLAVIMLGDDPASQVYVRNKRKASARAGIRSRDIDLPDTTTQAELLEIIDGLNAETAISGILVQLPLPDHIDSSKVIERIRPDKDVDGFHPYNVGRLAQRIPLLRPCTPVGVIKLLESVGHKFFGEHAVIVGASNLVGRPMMLELLLQGCTTTICHKFTRNVPELVAEGDIVVVATGKPQLVQGDWIKPGATVIDVGIHRQPDGSFLGDVAFDDTKERAGAITPVPGGVGPMTVACLLENTLQAAEIQDRKTEIPDVTNV